MRRSNGLAVLRPPCSVSPHVESFRILIWLCWNRQSHQSPFEAVVGSRLILAPRHQKCRAALLTPAARQRWAQEVKPPWTFLRSQQPTQLLFIAPKPIREAKFRQAGKPLQARC